jgi:hypothetical protein
VCSSDLSGYHESYHCGHDKRGVFKLVQNYHTTSTDHIPVPIVELIGTVAQRVINKVTKCDDHTVEFPDFCDIDQYPDVIPKNSSTGLVGGIDPSLKKEETYSAVIDVMISTFTQVKALICDNNVIAARALINDMHGLGAKFALKVEMAGPKLDDKGQYVDNRNKARLFCAFSFFSFIMNKMLFASFTGTGSGTSDDPRPIGIGININGCAANLIEELFQTAFVDGTFDDFSQFEADMLKKYHIVHGDFSKYDLTIRHWLMMLIMQLWCRKFDMGTDKNEFIFRQLILECVINNLVSKVLLCPFSGVPFHVDGTLPSGHYLTAMLNSIISLIIQRVVIMLMCNKSYEAIDKYMRDKEYGDDFLLVISKLLMEKFDAKQYSWLMKRLFNMNIPVEDIFVCTKLFRDLTSDDYNHTIDNLAPVYLQHQFGKIKYDNVWYAVMFRNIRPTLGTKLFLSSERQLKPKDLCQRVVAMALVFGVHPYLYEALSNVYDHVYKLAMALDEETVDDEPFQDEFIQSKMVQFCVNPEELYQFPIYDDVIKRAIGDRSQHMPRVMSANWREYKLMYEKDAYVFKGTESEISSMISQLNKAYFR